MLFETNGSSAIIKFKIQVQDFKISRFQDFKFQDFKISRFQDFKISRFQDFKISRSFHIANSGMAPAQGRHDDAPAGERDKAEGKAG